MLKSAASRGVTRHRSALDGTATTLICFSHLRWDFVYQRPQHLMTRFSQYRRVYYIEEPMFGSESARCDVSVREHGLRVVVPWLPHDLSDEARDGALRYLLDDLMEQEGIARFVSWYYTPMALPWTRHLSPEAVVYDCMDELSMFRGAPLSMVERERELLAKADVVFTGGTSLYESKRSRSNNVHCFPSSVDAGHFRLARSITGDPADQKDIPHLRLGFAGVIDERMDIELLDQLASARPDWHLVLLGPVVKIDPAQLPRRANIHYLGAKSYSMLPAYLAGWDIGLLPFALNEATRYISPTKTPEYLAAGLPVVSTAIRDVVTPYGIAELVQIGNTAEGFIAAVENELSRTEDERSRWLTRVDGFLSTMSWDRTQERMASLIARARESASVEGTITKERRVSPATASVYNVAAMEA